MLRLVLYCSCLSLVLTSPLSKRLPKNESMKDISGRVFNGEFASVGQFPWQVAMYFLIDPEPWWFCGGTLISEQWVLTSGYCVDGAEYVYIIFGSIDFNDGVFRILLLDTFILHEGYNPTTLANDIALVPLMTSVTLDNTVTPIALPTQPLAAGQEITVSGWGLTTDDPLDTTDILKYITVTTIENSECALTYGSDFIIDSFVCAAPGDPIKSPCTGDIGSPAVVNAATDPVLVAIVTFIGSTGCESGYPSGYTRVSSHMDWITNTTGIEV